MESGVDNVLRAIAAANAVAHFSQVAFRKFTGHAGNVVDAADFLHRSRGNGKNLSADTEQDDLFGAGLRRFFTGGKIHQRTPTKGARVRARTRFSKEA